MNKHDLFYKHYVPCFNAIYAEAQCCADIDRSLLNYDTLVERAPKVNERYDHKIRCLIPFECFYLKQERQNHIVEEYTKGLRGSWYYPHKFGAMDRKGWQADDKKHSKILNDFRKFEDEVSKDKSLTPYKRRAKIRERAIKDGFQWRRWDAEAVSRDIHLGPSPSGREDLWEIMKQVYVIIDPVVTANASIFKPWKKEHAIMVQNLPAGEKIGPWEIQSLQYQEAESFKTLVSKVSEECFNKIHDDLNLDKWHITEKIEHCTALWVILHWESLSML